MSCVNAIEPLTIGGPFRYILTLQGVSRLSKGNRYSIESSVSHRGVDLQVFCKAFFMKIPWRRRQWRRASPPWRGHGADSTRPSGLMGRISGTMKINGSPSRPGGP